MAVGRPKVPTFPVGTVFPHLTVVAHSERKDSRGFSIDLCVCRCTCGTEVIVEKGYLRKNPGTKCRSCAAKLYRSEQPPALSAVYSREYRSWKAMHTRCYDTNHAGYKNYGGRGITVCGRWGSFENFLADMGERPEGMTLERKQNGKGYSPANCVWATDAEQRRNTRTTRLLTVRGETKTMSEWARTLGVKPSTVYLRLRGGWSVEDACTTPVAPRKRST